MSRQSMREQAEFKHSPESIYELGKERIQEATQPAQLMKLISNQNFIELGMTLPDDMKDDLIVLWSDKFKKLTGHNGCSS